MKCILLSLLLFLVFNQNALADQNDLTHRPKSFLYDNHKVVFVDFEEAKYTIEYDLNKKKAVVRALIYFNVIEEGMPVIDLVEEPLKVLVDKSEVQTKVIPTPQFETSVRIIQKSLPVGPHSIQIHVPLNKLVQFDEQGVKSAFWVTDLDDRSYLEQFIPVNFEFDRVKMNFHVKFFGKEINQLVMANGKVLSMKDGSYHIEFPDYFTVNSLYFHTTPVETVDVVENNYLSLDGRNIPILIYTAKKENSSQTLQAFSNVTLQTLKELESDYGPFPHPKIIILNSNLSEMGLGGMEYAGATVTDKYSLPHELTHSYFGRGVTPANGNAGWIDEAIASWRDNNYNRIYEMSGTSSMASRAYYTRKTDLDAYSFGARFIAYLDGKFSSRGGLKPFLNKLLEKKIFTPIFTEELITEMESFYGEEVQSLFQRYVYGKTTSKTINPEAHSFHRKPNEKQLKAILQFH